MIRWRAYYSDGNIYNSRDHHWEDIPDDGVVCVVVYNEWIPSSNKTKRYRLILDGYDWYFRYIDTIISNNDLPKENQKRFPEAEHFKRGKWVSRKMFVDISEQASNSRWFDEAEYKEKDCGCE